MVSLDGVVVTKKYNEADRWYSLASDQGHAGAQYTLGLAYYYGSGTVKNYELAYMWVNVLLSINYDQERSKLRDTIASKLSKSQIKKSQALSQACIDSNYKALP